MPLFVIGISIRTLFLLYHEVLNVPNTCPKAKFVSKRGYKQVSQRQSLYSTFVTKNKYLVETIETTGSG